MMKLQKGHVEPDQQPEVVPWYRTAKAVAERKEKSRNSLVQEGGRELRAIRLDREANEAFEILKSHLNGLDNGAIVRFALVEQAKRAQRNSKR